jgi:two-component system, sensor histidine kinase
MNDPSRTSVMAASTEDGDAVLRERRRRLAMERAKLSSFYVDFITGEITGDNGGALGLPSAHSLEDLLVWMEPEFHPAIRNAWEDHLATGAPAMVEAVVRTVGGAAVWSELWIEAVRDSAGKVVGLIGARQDVSRRKAVELELMEQSRRAEAASHAKGEFLANMSHEIRTPLNGMLTMAQVMAHGDLSPEQRDLLCIVRQSGQDLLHLLNDILDFSKIEAGKLELEETEFDPEKVLESTLAGFAALAEKKDLQLWLDVAPSARGLRRGDPARLRQIISNFVSNALKFTDKGGVRIVIEGFGDRGRDGLQLAVKDSGLGIPADKMQLLFRKFSQVDASTTRRYGGTGLGLAICQELAHLMNGRVWAESVEGEGSTFYAKLRLPYLRDIVVEVSGHGEMDDFGAAPQTLKLLAAEDNPTNQVVLSTVMQVFGFDLTLVGDGAKAVEAWRREPFDVILMDVQMPVMDGVQATRAIRAEEAARGLRRTPIIALSANAFHHQISEYLSAGMDTHVAKPIELSALQAALEYVVSLAEPEPLAEAV